MSDYIEREKLHKRLNQIVDVNNLRTDRAWFTPYGVNALIEEIPAADVRPVVKAEWYGEGDGYADGELVYDMWSCPICGKRFEEWEEKPDWNFCPNCGADMREVLGDE